MVTLQGEKYMTDFEAKKAILDIGKRMYDKGFVAANDGNISCKTSPRTIWTTPTGVSKGFMTQDMLVKMDLEGKILIGRMKPSSEVKMHLRVYKENPGLKAVTHAHPPVATSFAIAGISLDSAILTEAVMGLGTIPVAKYATPGTQEVPDSIAPFVNAYNGVLLANHGALTWGNDLYQAFYRLESIEYYATILMYTGNIIGRQNILSCSQVNKLLEIRKKLGITSGGIPPCAACETNDRDIITSDDIRPLEMVELLRAGSTSGKKLLDSEENTNPCESQTSHGIKGVTPLVKPGDKVNIPSDAAACDRTKEEIIAEVVRRVVEELKAGGTV